jgi:DNA polymerase-1
VIKLSRGYLVENTDELPDFSHAEEVFLDIESRNYLLENILRARDARAAKAELKKVPLTDEEEKLVKHGGLYPFGGDRICGISVCIDNEPDAYYIPIRHIDTFLYKNLDIQPVMDWVQNLLKTCKVWVNHNVNFDAQFLAADDVFFECGVACTLTLSKIIDSDRLSHELKVICPEYLGYDVESTNRVKEYLKSRFGAEKWFNYAAVPIDILGEYANDDVLMNRQLYRYLLNKLDESQYQLWETEKKLTAVLFDTEYTGLMINQKECKIEAFKSLHNMIKYGTIIKELAGVEFTNSSQCVFDILCNQFGMPVLVTKIEKKNGKYIDTGRPTFEKDALALYEVHPIALADEKLRKVINAIRVYRKESQFKSLYADTFQFLSDTANMVHPSYNQTVRTGRMSAKRPNSQQQNERSKRLIHPRDGYGFISCDYSQVEYRLIAHYIQDPNLIDAYNNDATTDFHAWVAGMMHVTRKVGKTLNFGMAYGAGMKKVVKDLTSNPDIIKEISERVNKMIEENQIPVEDRARSFIRLCAEHATNAYNEYHEKVPKLKATSNQARKACKLRGYIFNAYGRRRHLPSDVSYKAFNSLIQSCAMDMIKERMVFLSSRFNKKMRDWDIRIAANVHDEVLFECPLSIINNPEVKQYIIEGLESPSIEFRIPFTTDFGVGQESWAQAAYDDKG